MKKTDLEYCIELSKKLENLIQAAKDFLEPNLSDVECVLVERKLRKAIKNGEKSL